MIDRNNLIKLTRQLIGINSENPGGNEHAIACFVKDYLEKIGIESRIYEFSKRRSNLIAMIRGNGSESSLLITPHLDTVPRGRNWCFDPFRGEIRNGKIYGLGATDCKCNLAVSLEVIRSLREEKYCLNYDLVLAATADEESGSALGIIKLLEKRILRPRAALVLDSDDFHLIVTQKGLMHLKVKLEGKRAHGAYPWRGQNAIEMAAAVIRDLKAKKLSRRKNKYLREATVNVGTIKGGDKVNIVADYCEFELDFRFLPGDSAQALLRDLKRILRKCAGKFSIEIQGIQQPFSISTKHPLVRQLVKAMQEKRIKPFLEGSEGATVISFFQQHKIPAIAWGFGQDGCAHTADEYVKIASLYKGAQALEYFLKNFKFY